MGDAKYYKDNREHCIERSKKYYSEHKEERATWYKKYREENGDWIRKRSREHYHANKDRIKEDVKEYKSTPKGKEVVLKSRLKRCYNMTLEQFKDLLNVQNNSCAICGETFVRSKFTHVDHDHELGKVRGLLCSKCNTGIGLFNHNIGKLLKATEYLKLWEKKDDTSKVNPS